MENWGFQELEALKELTGANEAEEEDGLHVYGSSLNPQSLHHKGQEKKELARPNAEIVVKTNTRSENGGASEEALMKARAAIKLAGNPKDNIWNDEEVNVKAEEKPDDRPEPEYEII